MFLEYIRKLNDVIKKAEVTDSRQNTLPLQEGLNKCIDILKQTKIHKKQVIIIGNGGSAAIAAHFQNDLCASAGLKSLIFFDFPLLTALSNDFGYKNVFSICLDRWAHEEDILIAISSSGESTNILNGVIKAKEHKMHVITFSGFKQTNSLRKLGHINFYIPSEDYGIVESSHGILTHYISDILRKEIKNEKI